MYIDEVKMEVKAGDGGNGIVAYRREKYIAFGGPAGGSGGSGGSVIFVGDSGKHTLIDLSYRRHLKADRGENGKNKSQQGKSANNTYLRVPLGTIVYREDGSVVGEIINHGEELIVARGGRGGRGNVALATGRNTCPDYAERGEPGEKVNIKVELKVLADVGLIGFPNAGKSTLLSVISNANPKIANYEFTTLNPNLGIVKVGEESSFVMADLPGLIENAHLGVGLGFKFLRHIERCRVLLHLVSLESENPYHDYEIINNELASYDPKLLERKQIVIATKTDLDPDGNKLNEFMSKLSKDVDVIPISSITHNNIEKLKYDVMEQVNLIPPIEREYIAEYVYKEENKDWYEIKVDDSGIYHVVGPKIERLYFRLDLNNDSALKRFVQQLRFLGVDDALRANGIKNGDTVKILEYEFEFID